MNNLKHSGIGMTSMRTRQRLIDKLRDDGIKDELVLNAIADIPRHLFVDEALAHRAYGYDALPIGHGQTLSSAYTVAMMSAQLCQGQKLGKVLEIGTGSGYQTSVLSRLSRQVFSVERIEPLQLKAKKRLKELSCFNVQFQMADGHWGWPDAAPFDAIICTAAPEQVPQELIEQLAEGGRMICPVGNAEQQTMIYLEKTPEGIEREALDSAMFVPMVRD